MTGRRRYARMAVSGPMRRSFVYSVPRTIGRLQVGQRLIVPFGRIRTVGYHLGKGEPRPDISIRDVLGPQDERSFFSLELFKFCIWLADYYFANPADCLATALPSLIKSRRPRYVWANALPPSIPDPLSELHRPRKRLTDEELARLRAMDQDLLTTLIDAGVLLEHWPDTARLTADRVRGYRAARIEQWQRFFARAKTPLEPFDGMRTRAELMEHGFNNYYLRRAVRDGLLAPVFWETPDSVLPFVKGRGDVMSIQPNEEQRHAISTLADRLGKGFQVSLLHGVTGSGKTLVYCHLARAALALGKTVLVLTPEIALAGTTLAYFRGFFGKEVTVIHSAMTDRERLDSWDGVRKGVFKIAVGPRSAVFAPLVGLGLIVVDEEHDGSYKQNDPTPRFHGRDAAIMRAKINNIPIVLGSASPSVESFYNARQGRYQLLQLTARPSGSVLPVVRIIDMRRERIGGDVPHFSLQLKNAVQQRINAGEQTILFLNRRGYAPHLKCNDCGAVPDCPNCRVKLTYHKVGNRLSCHYCGYIRTGYHSCFRCESKRFLYIGAGTQRVEENLPRLLENARPLRLDSDSAAGRRKAYDILMDFASRKGNLLLGTQMVTKGLDLPDVTLVGVLSADISLDLPDFRAEEKAFARLLQVAGRAGRAKKRGEVYIQTFYPDYEVIEDAARQDYESFYERQVASREPQRYPPFARLVDFVLSGEDEQAVRKGVTSFRNGLGDRLRSEGIQAQILGPAPCPLYFLKGVYRRRVLVKTRQVQRLVRMLTGWEETASRFKLPSAVKIAVDVDPDDMM